MDNNEHRRNNGDAVDEITLLKNEIARLRKELAAKERDYGILLNSHVDLTHKLNSMRVELRDAQQREREALAMLLECHSNNCCCDLYDDYTNMNSQSPELRSMLSRAREQENNSAVGGA